MHLLSVQNMYKAKKKNIKASFERHVAIIYRLAFHHKTFSATSLYYLFYQHHTQKSGHIRSFETDVL